ncbi:MAG TPA: hypothetical protein PKK96_02880 [Anaerolineales bacterium]|nr:hypothetical protein [Anaerolineales bacterium]HMS00080.1 hypothetical protein [Anaerolineales bacterium]HNQ94360.1 hypothetical protein [Anaerolineales bacterium]HNS59924.1 hypothetical protein [Anaerolineales bacterium]
MNQNRKYLGMTIPQLGVLGALAGTLVLILCVAGYFIFTGGVTSRAPQPVAPTLVIPTATLVAPPTSTPTLAPTAIPYEQLIPQGWKQQKTANIEIWLPSDYRQTTVKDLVFLDKQISVELTLSRTPTKTSLYHLYVIIAREPLRGDSVISHLESSPTDMPAAPTTFRVVEERNVLLNTTPAVRLLVEGKSTDNVDVNTLVYVFLEDDTVWYVEYWTQINEFYNQLETFEKSILTFRLVK